jgi:hypothetical protein
VSTGIIKDLHSAIIIPRIAKLLSFVFTLFHIKLVTVSSPVNVHVNVRELFSCATGDDGDNTTSAITTAEINLTLF